METRRVKIVGAGGLGHAAIWGLVSSWPREQPLEIDIFDRESVELSNLNRQVLFTEDNLGEKKVTALSSQIGRITPHPLIKLVPHDFAITAQNADSNLSDADYLIDATDSVQTKFLLNDFAVSRGIPFCYAGAIGSYGQLLSVDPRGACLRCLFGNVSAEEFPSLETSCRQGGIIGPVVNHIGFLQAESALGMLLGTPPGKTVLTRFSLETLETTQSDVFPQPSCSLGCAERRYQKLNLTDKRCPLTFVYTKLALEKLDPHQRLDVLLDSENTAQSVMTSCREEGYRVLGNRAQQVPHGFRLTVEK